MKRLRRALALLPSAGLGGAEAQTAVLLRALAQAGVTVSAAIEPALKPGLAALLPAAVQVFGAPLAWWSNAPAAANIARQTAEGAALLEAAAPDLVLLPLPWPTHAIGLMRATAAAGLPGIAIAHLAPAELAPEEAALADGVAAASLAWVAVSAPVGGRVAGIFGLPPGAVTVVPNGVTVPPPDAGARAAARAGHRAGLGLAPETPVFLFAGRLEEKKNAGLLPALAESLAAAAEGAVLVVLGEGPLAARLAAHPAAGGALRLLGQVASVGDWLLAADALVLPSRLEGCPLVVLEAAARYCPVVATAAAMEAFGPAAGGMARIVTHPTIADLTAHCAAMLSNHDSVNAMAAAAHAFALGNNQDFMIRRYLTVFRVSQTFC